MSWSEIQRTLFYKGICETPPLGAASSSNTEAIRDLINSAHKRFQKKITLNDVNNELKKEYNLPSRVSADNTNDSHTELHSESTTNSSPADTGRDRSVSPETDIKIEDEGGNTGENEPKADNKRNSRKTQPNENSRAKSLSVSPRPRTRRQRALRGSTDMSDAEDSGNTFGGHKDLPEDVKVDTNLSGSSESEQVDEKVKEESELEGDNDSANESDDASSGDESSDESSEEGNNDDDDNESSERETSAPAEESDTEKMRGRRASRAARPSMRRDSLSPARRSRAPTQRSKTPESTTPNTTRASRPNMKRVREAEEQGEVSDSESEDLPPSKRRAKRRQANAEASNATAGSTNNPKRANSRKRAESVPEDEDASKAPKKPDSKTRPSRKAAPKSSSTKGSSSRGRASSRRR